MRDFSRECSRRLGDLSLRLRLVAADALLTFAAMAWAFYAMESEYSLWVIEWICVGFLFIPVPDALDYRWQHLSSRGAHPDYRPSNPAVFVLWPYFLAMAVLAVPHEESLRRERQVQEVMES